MTTQEWDARFDGFWEEVDRDEPAAAHATLEALLGERGLDDARAAYERGSLHDSLGEEDDAVPLYRDALARGLDASLQTQATIQLASTLRNLGDASGAIALLRGIPADDPLAESAQAFLALALFSDDKPAAALRTALQSLAPHMPRSTRAVGAYAGELTVGPRIRAIAVGLLIHAGWVLAEEYVSADGSDRFLRAPGGGITVGEPADTAVYREFAEELGVTLDSADLLGVTENIYDRHGMRGHEVVFVFGIRCAALESLPRTDRLPVLDSDTTVGWYRLDDVGTDALPFYPAGCLELAV